MLEVPIITTYTGLTGKTRLLAAEANLALFSQPITAGREVF